MIDTPESTLLIKIKSDTRVIIEDNKVIIIPHARKTEAENETHDLKIQQSYEYDITC